MQRRSQKLDISLDIQAISCPGVWLSSAGSVYLSVCLLGHHVQTRDTAPVFPFMFHEHFVIEKLFGHVFRLCDLDEVLEAELVYMELVQRPHAVLATFETSVREFLFPNITTTPQYSGADLDLLLEPTRHFPGALCPRLEVSTRTTAEEVRTAAFSRSPRARTRRALLNSSAGSAADTTGDAGAGRRRHSSPADRSAGAAAAAAGSGGGGGGPTVPSSPDGRPPFVWRRADASLLGRQPGAPAAGRGRRRRSRSLGALTPPGRGRHCHCACSAPAEAAGALQSRGRPRARSASAGGGRRSAAGAQSPEERTAATVGVGSQQRAAGSQPTLASRHLAADWCGACGRYTTHHHCAVCAAYGRYFGRPYPGHHHLDCCYCYCPVSSGARTVYYPKCTVSAAPADSDSDSYESPSRWRGRRAYYQSMEELYRGLAAQAGQRARRALF